MTLLDKVPLATVLAIGGAALAFIAYLNGDLTVFEALGVFGLNTLGAGQLGQARNGAGRGVK